MKENEMRISIGDKLFIYRRGYHAMRSSDREEATVVDICLLVSNRVYPPKTEISLLTSAETVIKADIQQLLRWLEHACIFQHEADAIYKLNENEMVAGKPPLR